MREKFIHSKLPRIAHMIPRRDPLHDCVSMVSINTHFKNHCKSKVSGQSADFHTPGNQHEHRPVFLRHTEDGLKALLGE